MNGKALTRIMAVLMIAILPAFSSATIIQNSFSTTTIPAKESKCFETDYGKNYGTQGITRGINGIKGDYCLSYRRLLEYYCRGDTIVSAIVVCPNGCVEGACVGVGDALQATSTTTSTTATTQTTLKKAPPVKKPVSFIDLVLSEFIENSEECTDSDNGMNFISKGVASGSNGRSSDKCIDQARVREFFCDGILVRNVVHDCYDGCYLGACRLRIS